MYRHFQQITVPPALQQGDPSLKSSNDLLLCLAPFYLFPSIVYLRIQICPENKELLRYLFVAQRPHISIKSVRVN